MHSKSSAQCTQCKDSPERDRVGLAPNLNLHIFHSKWMPLCPPFYYHCRLILPCVSVDAGWTLMDSMGFDPRFFFRAQVPVEQAICRAICTEYNNWDCPQMFFLFFGVCMSSAGVGVLLSPRPMGSGLMRSTHIPVHFNLTLHSESPRLIAHAHQPHRPMLLESTGACQKECTGIATNGDNNWGFHCWP